MLSLKSLELVQRFLILVLSSFFFFFLTQCEILPLSNTRKYIKKKKTKFDVRMFNLEHKDPLEILRMGFTGPCRPPDCRYMTCF